MNIRKYGDRSRSVAPSSDEIITKQAFKDECDINNLLSKYQKTGLVTHVNNFKGEYLNLSQPVDYQTALNVVINADAAFASLPSSIRKKFDNDPHEFLQFTTNPDNHDAMVEMGLVPKKTQEKPSQAPPANVEPVTPPEVKPDEK